MNPHLSSGFASEPAALTLVLYGAQAIQLLGALLLASYLVRALAVLLRYRSGGIERARLAIANGALAALGFEVAATILKTLALQTWTQLGIFAVIFGLRIVLKRVFLAERRVLRAAEEG